MCKFNVHNNKTSDGVPITLGLAVFTNEMEVGTVVADTDREPSKCCEEPTHVNGQMYVSGGGWFTNHAARNSCDEPGKYCGHNHWFRVEVPNGKGGTFDGERLATTHKTYEGTTRVAFEELCKLTDPYKSRT